MRSGPLALLVLFVGLAVEVPGASASHALSITAPAEGATVGGVVAIQTADTASGSLHVIFEWSPTGTAPFTQIADDTTPSADGWSASWDTGTYSGPATIRARGLGAGDVEVDADTVGVIVDNVGPAVTLALSSTAFSPNGDGRVDGVAIDVTSDEAGTVAVRILDAGGSSRREFAGVLAGPGTARFVWDGSDGGGAVVGDAAYTVEATSTGVVPATTQRIAPVFVDTAPPAAAWRRIAPDPASGRSPIAFRVRSQDRAEHLTAEIRILDRLGGVRTHSAMVHEGTDVVRWRPSYRSGRALLPGLYVAALTVTDDAGNVSPSRERKLRILRRVHARVFRRVEGAGKRVAITIDDCHYRTAWASMLRTLKRMNVRATFFCPGDRMLIFKDLARRTVREGHLLASHGWDHAALAGKGFAATAVRLRKDLSVAWRLTGDITAPYFRPPYGSYDGTVVAAAGATGHARVMMWDVSTGDTAGVTGGALVSNAVRPARRGSVILMHTLDKTAAALPAIIRGLRAKGLRPVRLDALFRAAGYR